MKFEDTIIAPATVPGTGAISVVRISGPRALALADSMVRLPKGDILSSAGNTVRFGTVFREDGSVLDEVLCSVFRAPHSYTGEDSVEISCHASSYIVSELLTMAVGEGARMAEPGEFTQRAFLSGKMDLAQAEAVADVIAASTSSAHDIAFRQLKGAVSKELDGLRERLLQMTSLMELELDFSEEDVEFADRGHLDVLLQETISRIDSLLGSFRLGNAVKRGVGVAIVGAANAGKSTLMNALLGEQRSIVSDIPGTTRDTVEETFNHDGVLFRLVDTAGIRDLSSVAGDTAEIERMGIERSLESVRKSDIILVVIDASSDLKYNIKYGITQLFNAADISARKLVFALNKSDLLENEPGNNYVRLKNEIVSFIDNELNISGKRFDASFISLSAKQGKGISELLGLLSDYIKLNIKSAESESSIISSARHYEALLTSRSSLEKVRLALRSGIPSDLAAEDLREALDTLGSITGKISSQEVLNNIFGKFCIGK